MATSGDCNLAIDRRCDMHDLVIRGGTVVGGTGAPARTADVAVTDGVITEVGRVAGPARQELDADGLVVMPGFIEPAVGADPPGRRHRPGGCREGGRIQTS